MSVCAICKIYRIFIIGIKYILCIEVKILRNFSHKLEFDIPYFLTTY